MCAGHAETDRDNIQAGLSAVQANTYTGLQRLVALVGPCHKMLQARLKDPWLVEVGRPTSSPPDGHITHVEIEFLATVYVIRTQGIPPELYRKRMGSRSIT